MAKDLIPSTYPLTPPLTEEEWLTWLRLLRSRRVGISTFYRLLSEFGDAAAALDALPGIARDAGLTEYRAAHPDDIRREWDSARRTGAQPIAIGSPAYPDRLADITDAPPILWTIGNPDYLARPTIAIVGARNASSLGTRTARRLAADLGAAGFAIVSGLARGVDTAAHIAALDTGTIAVMAGGVDVIYPKENTVLAQEIAEKGCRISEIPIHETPTAHHFPRRNRLVSGLAQAVVVVEAAAKSGSLITARTALDQGRDVLAVPGHPFDARASGCNMLIRDGATLVRSAQDVIDTLARPTPSRETAPIPAEIPRPAADTRALHQQILERIGPSPTPEDEVIRDLNISPDTLLPEIAALEILGAIQRDAGGLLRRLE
ncbi:DNA-processing protein DprA [Boseongicola aestuarii]|uniref:Uncharacterized protein n=1 Tax=Boseongicola aestuarii TaxID=1470561 RepID=A0A238IY77_9RHOB|nr:DNA-processing protein DprA [Boseongicola aestuarii]SMX22700.1 hypothetical protein BOA8489_00798 [Boseongicola aestuarii]